MQKTTLMFGSIGAVMETSDVQRRAYNQALKEAGLNWEWSPETYGELLSQSGGKERLSMLASATGAKLSPQQIEAIHARKTKIACDELAANPTPPRPGVMELFKVAKSRNMKLAFVTTTYRPNIDAIFQSANGALSADDFDYIGTRDNVEHGKPSPEPYLNALKQLDASPDEVLAIEDTAASVMSAKRAGLQVVATPGALSGGQDLWQADLVCHSLLTADNQLDPRVLAMLG
jgi:HAD superfamily hydrolase (TIGR01509 family)